MAHIILEREEGEAETEIGIACILINAGEDITVSVRKSERINSDGTLGFFPDATVISSTTKDQVSTISVCNHLIKCIGSGSCIRSPSECKSSP